MQLLLKKIIIFFLTILFIFIIIPTPTILAQSYKIKVGVSPVVSSSGIFLAQEKGYFKELKLEVDIIYFKNSGAPMTLLLTNGQLDIGGGNISSGLWNAINQGAEIKLVADKGHIEKEHSYICLLVRKDHIESGRYKNFQDLKGFKMGITAFGVSQEIATEEFLKAGGRTIQDVSFEKMPYSQMNIALQNKELDATIQLEPYIAQALQDNIAIKVAQVYDVYPNQQSAAIFYSPSFIKQHPELAEKFMIAYLKGVRAYQEAFIGNYKKTETINLLKKHIKIESNTIWKTMIPVGLNTNGFLNTTSLINDILWYKQHKYIDKTPILDNVIDNSYIEKALKIIGTYESKE